MWSGHLGEHLGGKLAWIGKSVKEFIKARREGKVPQVGLIHNIISHDDDCRIYRASPCSCDADVRLIPHADEDCEGCKIAYGPSTT